MGLSKSLAAACGLAAMVNGHMLMATPARATTPLASNSPLDPSGSNFPCQLKSGETLSGESTSMALGSDQPLEFIGESVHGGGSCQISVTYDQNPSASSTWKVITSFEGGCPAKDTAGNLGTDTSAIAPDPYTYNFTVPEDIPTGKAVLAWTWFNKVGNREMYMNCAMVELTGTSGSKSNYDALPDMFTANIQNGECLTEANTNLKFPDPGSVVQRLNGASATFGGVKGTGCKTSSAQATSASASTAYAPSQTTGIFASISASIGISIGAPVPTTTAAAPFAPIISSSSSPTSASAVVSAQATSTTTEAPAATSSSSSGSSPSSSSSSSSGSQTAGSACQDEGDYVCLGSDSYLVCASGLWTKMPIAAGTGCSGSGVDFKIEALTSGKFKKTRAMRWVQRSLPFLG